MHQSTLIVLDSRDIWPSWLIQLPDSTNQEVTLELVFRVEFGVLGAFCSGDLDLPLFVFFIPLSAFHRAVESDVGIQVVLAGNRHQVGEDLLLSRILARPVL